MSWGYLIMIFFEPANRLSKAEPREVFRKTFIIELVIQIFFLFDCFIDVVLRISLQNKSNSRCKWCFLYNLFKSKKSLFRIIFNIVSFSDFLIYSYNYPGNVFRYSRIIRPIFLALYSKDLRRSVKGLLKTIK